MRKNMPSKFLDRRIKNTYRFFLLFPHHFPKEIMIDLCTVKSAFVILKEDKYVRLHEYVERYLSIIAWSFVFIPFILDLLISAINS